MSSYSKDSKSAFDLALKQLKGGDITKGYSLNGRYYYAYQTKEEWMEFLNEMKSTHSRAYSAFYGGYGNELFERKSASGKKMPPKMASYASSSRFIYEESMILGDKFDFECKLPIAFMGVDKEAEASLDGYIPSKHIFVEAKCHEIYSLLSTEYKPAYEGFYQYLHDKTGKQFDYSVTSSNGKKNYIDFMWNGKKLTKLDLKQLLCHMLGIAKKALLEDCSETSTLLYLVYRPGYDLLQLIPDQETRKFILSTWETERDETNSIDFPLLFRLITNYIYTERKNWQNNGQYSPRVNEISEAFAFMFCDQDEYRALIREILSSDQH